MLAFFALVMSIVLLPVAAYAVDAAVVAFQAATLQAATAQAAETAAQQIDIRTLRLGGGLALDPVAARRVAIQMIERTDPSAIVDSISFDGVQLTIRTSASVKPPFALLAGDVRLHAGASARLVAGYARPSSLLPLPSSTL